MATRLHLTGHYLSSGGSVYFETQRQLRRDEVSALDDIDGMTRYDVHGNMVSFSYGTTDWMEIAPQVILVLADASGIDINDIELVDDRLFANQRAGEDLSLPEVLEKARQLRPSKCGSCRAGQKVPQ